MIYFRSMSVPVYINFLIREVFGVSDVRKKKEEKTWAYFSWKVIGKFQHRIIYFFSFLCLAEISKMFVAKTPPSYSELIRQWISFSRWKLTNCRYTPFVSFYKTTRQNRICYSLKAFAICKRQFKPFYLYTSSEGRKWQYSGNGICHSSSFSPSC